MIEVELTSAARADLQEIRKFSIDQFDANTADAYFLGFGAAFDLLREHPLAGALKPELGKGIRCLVQRRHRIFYRTDKGKVLIIRIVHHARDSEAMLGKSAK